MSLPSLLRHIDRDNRHRARVASGLRAPKPVRDARIVHWGGVFRYAFTTKSAGMSIPEGSVVIAVRLNEHRQHIPVLVETFEGDRAGFAAFPRLALMLGATELQVGLMDRTMFDRARAVTDLGNHPWIDRAALLSRPLVVSGAFDRSAIMATACAVAKARQGLTGETWGACLSAALRGVWTLARAERLATAH